MCKRKIESGSAEQLERLGYTASSFPDLFINQEQVYYLYVIPASHSRNRERLKAGSCADLDLDCLSTERSEAREGTLYELFGLNPTPRGQRARIRKEKQVKGEKVWSNLQSTFDKSRVRVLKKRLKRA
jgi:hypothetical protein